MQFLKIELKIFILLLFTICSVFGIYPQYAMVYKNDNCFGEDYEYTFDSVENLTEAWANPVSLKVRGVWQIYMQSKSNPEDTGSQFIGDEKGSSCLLKVNETNTVTSFVKVMDAELEESAILLYNLTANLTSFFKVKEQEYSFPEPIKIKDVIIFGVKSYEIFQGTNFTGESYCAPVYPNEGYGLTIGTNPSSTIGSLRISNCTGPWSPPTPGQNNKLFVDGHESGFSSTFRETIATISAPNYVVEKMY